MSSYYIPRNDAEFNNWFKSLTQYVASKTSGQGAVWTHIPKEAVSGLNTAYADWYTAYSNTLSPHSKVETRAKNAARKSAEKVLRAFKGQYLDWPPVTDEDRIAMRLPVRDTIPTPIPPPSAQVEGDLSFPGVHMVQISRIRSVAGVSPDAKSDYGVRIYYGILGAESATDKFRLKEPPKTGSDLPHSVFTRKKKHTFDFEGESGNQIFICMRYENSKGEAGPFGPMLHAYIP